MLLVVIALAAPRFRLLGQAAICIAFVSQFCWYGVYLLVLKGLLCT